jgi:hypothetical protein
MYLDPITYGLHIPGFGEVNLVFWAVVVVLVFMFAGQIPGLLVWLGAKVVTNLPSLGKWIIEQFKGGGTSSPLIPKPSAAVADPLAALRVLTESAVLSGDAELLTQAVAIYPTLQKRFAVKVAAALLFICFVGCASESKQDAPYATGYSPPTEEEIQQYRGMDKSLKELQPELFDE